MRRTPPGCRAFSSMYVPLLSSFIGRQNIQIYPTTNNRTLSLGKCVHVRLSRALRRFSFEPATRIRSRPRNSRRLRGISLANLSSLCWWSEKVIRTWEYDPARIEHGHWTSRALQPAITLSHDYEAKTSDCRSGQRIITWRKFEPRSASWEGRALLGLGFIRPELDEYLGRPFLENLRFLSHRSAPILSQPVC